MKTFITLLAAIGLGSIISALVGHHVAISNHRQAWINALRDDIAEFVTNLEKLAYAVRDWMKDSNADGAEEKRRKARIELLFVYERIRLRLNRKEENHIALEKKLSEFINEPLLTKIDDRDDINAAIDLSRQILKDEWDVIKYPWKPYYKKVHAWTIKRV